MRSSFSAMCILLVFVQISTISASYNCDNTRISDSRLKEVVKQVKEAYRASWYRTAASRKLNVIYDGHPFLKPYLLWPVSPTTNDYDEATRTSFRAVINTKTSEVFSVIIKNGENVKECRLEEMVPNQSNTDDFMCKPGYHSHQDLELVAAEACPKIQNYATGHDPVRYDGPPFQGWGNQLYVYPASPGLPYIDHAAKNNFVVLNSACKVVVVVKRDKNLNYKICDLPERIPLSSPSYRRPEDYFHIFE